MKAITSRAEFDARIKRVIITEEEIKAAVKELGKRIDALYDGRPILLVGLLKGVFAFFADVCRAVTVPCEVEFLRTQSYFAGTVSTGEVRLVLDMDRDVSTYHVVLLEDIVDSGNTLAKVTALLKARHPLSFRVVTLLDKPSRRTVDFTPDESLFVIDDLFVIGYGLDCAEYYRNLPYIAEYAE